MVTLLDVGPGIVPCVLGLLLLHKIWVVTNNAEIEKAKHVSRRIENFSKQPHFLLY